jgi:signal transduction histidine kinase
MKIKMPKISIFVKLIIVILISIAVIYMAIMMVFRFSSEPRPQSIFPIHIRKVEALSVQQIGSPPDTNKAKEICNELHWNMRYQSHDFNWSTSALVPKLEELSHSDEFREKYPIENHFAMRLDDKRYSILKDSKGVFIIEPPQFRDFFNWERAIFLLIITITLIIIGLYFLLRWLFQPLKTLSAAVENISHGNYEISVPVNRKDELGELGESINNMTKRIKESIKTKEQLLLDVSHELRSPLTRIKLGLEVGSNKEKINDDVLEMERMITSLLENYRAGSIFEMLKPEKSNLTELVKEVIKDYNSDLRLWFKIPERNNVILNLDADKIKIVIRNVIDNALKYSGDKVEINITEKKDIAELCVKDKGTGIPIEDQKYIFEPFYRSDRSRSRKTGGFGLGLSISKKIMDAHNGKINIASKPGEGTIVTLIFRK